MAAISNGRDPDRTGTTSSRPRCMLLYNTALGVSEVLFAVSDEQSVYCCPPQRLSSRLAHQVKRRNKRFTRHTAGHTSGQTTSFNSMHCFKFAVRKTGKLVLLPTHRLLAAEA